MAETSEGGGDGSLFQGKQFWLSQNIPQRSRFKELIAQHGGIVRLLEKDADIKLVDHTKKNLPSDTYSYRYVEESIRKGQLVNLEAHKAGPSAARPVGATYIPTRGVKVGYSLQDDQHLWDWMQQFEGKPGYAISGNKIYQDLAAANPRHTFQSYRDRYLKRLRGRPRPGGMAGSTNRPPITHDDNHHRTSTPAPVPAPAPAPAAPSPSRTREERHPQRTESNINKQDDRKRKRSSEAETIDRGTSKDIETINQKRRAVNRTPEAGSSIPPQTETEHAESYLQPPEPLEPPEPTVQEAPETNHQTNDPENETEKLFLELPFFPSSPEPEEEEGSEPDIDEWIDNLLRTGKAQNDAQVIEALRCTSMNPRLANEALGHLVREKSIPDGVPGVWTAEDDRCLESGNARDIERMLKKHGTDFFNARWEYLGMARTAGLEDTGKQ